MGRQLDVTKEADTSSDVKTVGRTDAWELMTKASSKEQAFMHSTKMLDLGSDGAVLLVDTLEEGRPAKAMVWVPGHVAPVIRDAFDKGEGE